MILADTSAWVEYQRATGSTVDERMVALIATDGPLAFTEPVVMEFIGGARTAEAAVDLRRLLVRTNPLPFDAGVDFDVATDIYRRCRAQGITPRGFIDCMVAAVAFRNGASILTADRDLERIAEAMGIEIDRE